MSARDLHGLIAEFETPEALARAVEAARMAGYTQLEAFSPFPLRNVAEMLGARPAAVPWIATVFGFLGAAVQYGFQYWANAIDYPLNVGGRPLHSWPAFVPATLIVAIMWAGAATLLSLLVLLRLPQLNHPVFAVPGFERASDDRFFLMISSRDPAFEPGGVSAFLQALSPATVREVSA
jgi:hypothetical protein